MLLTDADHARSLAPITRRKRGRSWLQVTYFTARPDSKDLARNARGALIHEGNLQRAKRRWQGYEESSIDRDCGTESNVQSWRLARKPVVRKILEQFRGFVVKIEESWAHIILRTGQGEEFAGTYPVADLAAQGVKERDGFTLTTFEQGSSVLFDIKLIPRQKVSPAERRAIRERIERDLGDCSSDDDY